MKAVMIILLLAMIAKDASHINDPYIMRGFSQGLCFIVGFSWVLMNANAMLFKKYWPIFGYLFVSLVSGLLSPLQEHALIQTASLASVLLFAIAYFESQSKKPGDSSNVYFNTIIIAYTVVCIISILLIKLNYSIVYGKVAAWFVTNAVIRFRGLFSMPAMMGVASGLLVGYVLFRPGKWWWRGPALLSGLVCLALTQSRTFWIAAFVSSIFIWWIYKPQARKLLVAVTLSVSVIFGSLWMIGVSIDTTSAEKSARISSLSTLTGRIPLWEAAIDSISKSPFIGYGITIGSYALKDDDGNTLNNNVPTGRDLGHETLHNGYLQSILDLGLIGLFMYMAIFITALKRVYRCDENRTNGAVIYGVLFIAISNVGESVVYSASTSHSIVFWCVVIMALQQFKNKTRDERNADVKTTKDDISIINENNTKLNTTACKLK